MSFLVYIFWMLVATLVLPVIIGVLFRRVRKVHYLCIVALLTPVLFLLPYAWIALRTKMVIGHHEESLIQFAKDQNCDIELAWCLNSTTQSTTYYLRMRSKAKEDNGETIGYVILLDGEPGIVVGEVPIYGHNQQGGIFPPDPMQHLD